MKALLLSLAIFATALPGSARVSFLRYLEATAGQGEAESQLLLGLVYRDGWDGTIRPGSALERWCQLALEEGDQRPAFLLGQLQREQSLINPDHDRAMHCLSDAAERGDNYARVILGEMLLEGRGLPVDWRRGTDLIRRSALTGFAAAGYRMGVLYLIGDGSLPKDNVESLAWFIVAAESGSRLAQQVRDERTRLLGKEVAQRAVKLSRQLLVKNPAPRGGR